MMLVGSIVLGVSILLVGLLAVVSRDPHAPGWTRPELVTYLMVVPLTGAFGFGLGQMAYGVVQVLSGDGEPLSLLEPLAVAAAVAALWHLAGITRRLRAFGIADAAQAPSAPIELRLAGSKGSRPRPPASGARRPPRKAA